MFLFSKYSTYSLLDNASNYIPSWVRYPKESAQCAHDRKTSPPPNVCASRAQKGKSAFWSFDCFIRWELLTHIVLGQISLTSWAAWLFSEEGSMDSVKNKHSEKFESVLLILWILYVQIYLNTFEFMLMENCLPISIQNSFMYYLSHSCKLKYTCGALSKFLKTETSYKIRNYSILLTLVTRHITILLLAWWFMKMQFSHYIVKFHWTFNNKWLQGGLRIRLKTFKMMSREILWETKNFFLNWNGDIYDMPI